MIRPQDFQIRIDYDGDGPLVVVGHAVAGLEKRARPNSIESVGQVKERLLAEIKRELYDAADIRIDYMRGSRDGKIVGCIRVVHLPTGFESGFYEDRVKSVSEARLAALDDVIGQVWRAKSDEMSG